ncbi:hypothetical protein COHA_004917 [Chlorella ohadii]|uniref:Transcription factor IIIC 90kDa subunit N-terminal domain-containing protein n=1 Tax=Chlorella ohadii TaxID=2649997 RepID=A0AAD5DRS2_9CHLO|nr:hypothetical protein COHA_004917 [Chlorella ohadii]
MSAAQPLVDVLGLANRPVGADCIKWSEDGVLAVAAGHSAVLLRPGDLAGPRAFASPGGTCDAGVLQAAGRPAKPTEDAHHELANLRAAAMVSQYPSLQAGLAARSLGWSPAGCSAAAGCLLAAVTNDHQVLVYGPPAQPCSEWQPVADLSAQLLEHLEQTGWRDLQPPPARQQQQRQQGEEGCLRLRGGGATKRKAAAAAGGQAKGGAAAAPIYRPDDVFEATVGQEVEVMSAEEGLYGCWFTGTIQRLAGGWALGVGAARAVGDACDAFVNGGWWETARVVELQDGGQRLTVEVDGEQEQVELAHTRTTLRFTGGQWLAESTCAADVAAAAAAAAAAKAAQPAKKGGRKQQQQQQQPAAAVADESGEPGEEPPSKKRRSSKAAAKTAAAAAAATEPEQEQQDAQEEQKQQPEEEQQQQPEEEQQQQEQQQQQGRKEPGLRSPRKQRQPTAAHAGDGAAPPAAVDEPGSAAAAAAAGASSPGGAKSKKAPASTAKKTPASSAKKAPPTYEVPADFDPSVLPEVDLSTAAAAKRSVPTAFAKRFLNLRRLLPAAELPSYPATSSHLKGVDAELVAQAVAELLHVHGAALGALGAKLDAKWLNTEGRVKLRLVWDRVRNKLLGGFKVADGDASEPESDEETEDEQQAQPSGGGKSTGRRRAGRAGSAGPSGGAFYGEEGEEAEEEGQQRLGEAESDDELPTGRGKGRKKRSSAAGASAGAGLDFPPHELPEGFSWRSLPGVDFSNESAAKRTLLVSAVRRFLTLRSEYPEEEREEYEKKSSHLRGRDAWLVDRVTREFLAAYAQARLRAAGLLLMDDLKWTPKSFQTYWLSRLRAVWDKTTSQLSQGFSLEAEAAVLRSAQEAAEVALLGVGADPQAAEALASRGPHLQHRSPSKPKKSASRKSLAGLGGEEEEGGTRTAARSARSGGLAEDGYGSDQSGGLVLTSSPAKRKRKDLAAATAAARMRRDSSGGAKLSSAQYQHHLLGSSCTCCAWSPAVDLPPGAAAGAAEAAEAAAGGSAAAAVAATAGAPAAQRCCFLAVGAKAGRIWLWRYRLPAQYRLDQPQGDVTDSFQLVGCLAGSPGAWVNSLAWQLVPSSGSGGSSSSLVLVAGCSDGSVLLYGADAQQLAAVQQQALQTPDGSVACWRLAEASGAAGLALLPADGAPQPCGKRKKRSVGHCAHGLAVSPGGLFVAVVRLALSPAAEIVKQLQVHERVVQGLVQLDRLAGPGALLELPAALSAALASHTSCPAGSGDTQQLVQGCLAASSAWEAAAMLRLHARWQPSSAAEAAADAPAASSGAQEAAPAAAGGGDGGLVPPLARAMLQQLEQPMLDLLQRFQERAAAAGAASGEVGEGDRLLPQVPPAVWRSLQLATALRHLLDPARLQREQRLLAKKQLRKVGGSAPAPALLPLHQLLKVEPVEAAKQQKALQKQQAARAQAQAARQQEAQQRAAAAAAAAAAVLAAAAVPDDPLVQEWRAATERNEMLLLQRHLAAALAPLQPPEGEEAMDIDGGAAEPGAAAGAAGSEAQLSQLLMADWITLNVQDPGMLQEMDLLAASAYLHTGEEMLPHGAAMPARERSTLFDQPVAVAGRGVAAATQAAPPGAGGAMLPRCPASLRLCEGRPHWSCRACGRRYLQPQGACSEAAGSEPTAPLPACVFCGLPLGSAGPAVLFSPPCCS